MTGRDRWPCRLLCESGFYVLVTCTELPSKKRKKKKQEYFDFSRSRCINIKQESRVGSSCGRGSKVCVNYPTRKKAGGESEITGEAGNKGKIIWQDMFGGGRV